MNRLLFPLVVLVLVSCRGGEANTSVTRPHRDSLTTMPASAVTSSVSSSSWKEYQDQLNGYSIKLPSALYNLLTSNTNVAHNFYTWNVNHTPSANDYSVVFYNSSPSSHCQQTEIHWYNQHRNQQDGAITVWGPAGDYTEDQVTGKPLSPDCFIIDPWGIKFKNMNYLASYALCSEKNDKSVFICLRQVTDNPTLAKQIFDTFRWTK